MYIYKAIRVFSTKSRNLKALGSEKKSHMQAPMLRVDQKKGVVKADEEIEQEEYLKPVQYPKHDMNDPFTQIVSRQRASHRLDPQGEIPMDILEEPQISHTRLDDYALLLNTYSETHLQDNMKFMRIALVGEENSGKSSLLNALVGQHISLVASKAGSTQNIATGIISDQQSLTQVEIVDTIGIPKKGRVTKGLDIINDSDLIIFVVDASKNTISLPVRNTIQMISQQKQQVDMWLVFNKVDRVSGKRTMKANVMELNELADFSQTIYTSSLINQFFNIEALRQKIITKMAGNQYIHPWLYSSRLKTLSTPAELLEDTLRQAIFTHFFREIPFTLGVQLIEYLRQTNPSCTVVTFRIDCESNIQMKMVVSRIDRVRQLSQVNLAQAFGVRFQVNIRVVTRKQSLEQEIQKVIQVTEKNYGDDYERYQIEENREQIKQQLLNNDN